MKIITQRLSYWYSEKRVFNGKYMEWIGLKSTVYILKKYEMFTCFAFLAGDERKTKICKKITQVMNLLVALVDIGHYCVKI